jgi:hypothetical protein
MMDIGMLWFDNDKKSDLFTKVSRAAAYYRSKYGEEPNLCFVHPSMISEDKADAGKPETGRIEVFSNSSVLPNHFWIGVQQQKITSP